MRAVFLFLVLMSFWLLMSGHYSTFLIASGVVCCLFVVFVSQRKGVFALEGGHPVHPLLTGVFTYWPWMLGQIIAANWDVFKRVWHPRMPIDPQLVRVPYETKKILLTTIYANSITLTPGTVTVSVDDGEMEVHALSPEAAESLAKGEMHRRILRLDGEPREAHAGKGSA